MSLKMKGARWNLVAIALFAAVSLFGCKQDPYTLAIVGFNYTDRAVADFSVNGAWGGNLSPSTPTSGGGGTLCCVVMSRSTKMPFWVDVKYKLSALETFSPRKIIEPSGPYRTTRVEVTGAIPANPEYLEVHFYPDGHIEGSLSGPEGPSAPRLKLEARSGYAR
jgi:hypothetical protein